MSQETQPSPIDIKPSDIRLDPLQQRPGLDQSQVNPYFHQNQIRTQQAQHQGMYFLQQPMNNNPFFGMNNFENLQNQQALNQNFEAIGFISNNSNNSYPYQNYPVQQQQYPYDIQNLNLNNSSNSNTNPQFINLANNNNINNQRNNIPQQFFQLNDRQVDPIQIINPQRQQIHSNPNYITNKDKNNGNNDKRNHRSQQHQYQNQQQYKTYQQANSDHSHRNITQQFNNNNNHNNNHPNTTNNNNNQFYSNFPGQNYGNNNNNNNNHSHQKNYYNAPKSQVAKYQPKYIPQEHSSSNSPYQQQQKHQSQVNQAHLESDQEQDYQPQNQSQQTNFDQQQLPQDTNNITNNISKLHVSELKVHLCQRKDTHERKKCQFYHSEEDRRRNPEKYIYSMNLCPNQGGKYSQIDHCPLGDDCPQAHNKVERLYHPLRYKAKFCKDFSERKTCSYGDYCSFAHEDSEIVIPMIDKLKQDAIFFMYFYKTVWCPNISEHVRGDCPYIHNVQDFRRDPKQYKLEPRQCEDWKKDNIKTYQQGRCQKQLDCDHCHGWKEHSNHPMVYKTKPCNIPNCNQSNECVLYHSDTDKRVVTPELLAEEERIAVSIMHQLFKGKTSYDVQLGAPFEAFFSEEELTKNNEAFHSHNINNNQISSQWSNNNNNINTHGTQGNQSKNNNGAHRITKTQNNNGGYQSNNKSNHNSNNNNNLTGNNNNTNNQQFNNEIPQPQQQQYTQHHKHNQRGQQTYLPKSSYLQSQQQHMNVNVPQQAQTNYLPRTQQPQQQFTKLQVNNNLITPNTAETQIVEHNDIPQIKSTIKATSLISETPNEVIQIKPTSSGNIKEFSNFEVADDSTVASNQTDSHHNYFLNQLLQDSPPSSKTQQEHPIIVSLNQSRSDNYSQSLSQKTQINLFTGVVRQTSERLVNQVQGLNNNNNNKIQSNPIDNTINNFNSNSNIIDQVSGYFIKSVNGQGLSLIPPSSPHDQIDNSNFQEIASAFSQNESSNSNTNSERAYSRDSSVSKEDVSANTTLNGYNNSHSATHASNSAYSIVSQSKQPQHSSNISNSSSGIQKNKHLQQMHQQGSSLINCFTISSPPENLSNSRKDSYNGTTAATTPLQTNFDSSENKTKQIDFFVAHGLSEEQLKKLSTSDIDNLKFLSAVEKKALADHYEFQDIQNICNEATKDGLQNLD